MRFRRLANIVALLVVLGSLAPSVAGQVQEGLQPAPPARTNAQTAATSLAVPDQHLPVIGEVTAGKRGTFWPDGVVAIATGVIALFAILQWLIYLAMKNHNMAIERAYVGFGEKLWGSGTESDGWLKLPLNFQLQLHNFGTTPAEVERIVAAIYIAKTPLPEAPTEWKSADPRYGRQISLEDSRVFLVKDGDFWTLDQELDVTPGEWDDVRNRKRELWILGYIDYVDRFTRRHRAAFCRRFDRRVQWNLRFDPAPGYNYDREVDEAGNFVEPNEKLNRYLARFGS